MADQFILPVDQVNDTTLDPEWQSHQNQTQQNYNEWEANKEDNGPDAIENSEMESQAKEDKFSDVGDVVRGTLETALQPVLGVGDFASDVVGIVPWLKPVDEWWDNNSYRSTHPGHKLIRDASSIIIPTLAGGTAITGAARAGLAARSITLPRFAHTLGTVAAYTGVDTGVAMISSHSKTDDNLAGTLNNWLGWNIPWGTRTGDDPDTRWKKNVYEAAGFAGGVELLGAAFSFGKKAKLFPRDAGAEELINARNAKNADYDNALSRSVEPTRDAREAAQTDEMVAAIKADPKGEGGYNAFVHDIGEDGAGKAVVNFEADPLEAKLHQTQIQNNIGTYNGRASAVVDDVWQQNFVKAVNADERAKYLDDVFSKIDVNFDAIVSKGGRATKVTAEQMNKSVNNLTQAVFGKDISLKDFEAIVDDMKVAVFKDSAVLDDESWTAATNAFRQSYDKLFDVNQRKASAMVTQQAADTVADTAAAAKMIGEQADTSRQMKIIFDKMNLLDTEVKINDYISQRALEFRKVRESQDIPNIISWMNRQADDFDKYVAKVKATNNEFNDYLFKISKKNSNYFNPLKEAYYATNGNVDTLHKLKQVTDNNISLLKKGFIDQDPEMPSQLVKQLHGTRINSILSGLSPIRAALGNSMLTAIKPASVFVGAKATGNSAVAKRAQYVFGGIAENFKRGFKVMREEWNLASQFPDEAMMRGRNDLRMAKMEQMQYMDSMADVWKSEGELGKVAMWNMTKGLTWWNKQFFVKYGTNALYAIDGFTNSFMASGMARARAYDELFDSTNGGVDFVKFQQRQRDLYNQAFDSTGKLTDDAAKHASREIALNLDNKVVKQFENFLDHVPAAKPLFLFPRTGVNAFELAWSFNPASNLGPALTKARRVIGAKTSEQKIAALLEHGIDATQDADLAFATLKSEYVGRQIMGSAVVMGAGLLALEGNLTGNGPQDAAERKRMMAMGWQPNSIKNPITGDWQSYRGFEPFDKLLGLTGDIVYQSTRVDQAVTEDLLRKTAFSISMNLTNSTFISGFEPLVGLISSDPSSFNRFFARQTDILLPYKGVRSVLNNAITPQLKDVENDYLAYLANANKFLFPGNDYLKDMLDIYTGEPIKYHEPINAAFNAILPTFKTNGGMEPWRQWLLSTGWDKLQEIRVNKHTGEPLSTEDRHFMNNWIAKNANLRGQILRLMSESDGYWDKKLNEYVKARGLKPQSKFDIGEFVLHKELDRIHKRAFEGAWDALEFYKENYSTIGREKKWVNYHLNRGEAGKASETERFLRETKNK